MPSAHDAQLSAAWKHFSDCNFFFGNTLYDIVPRVKRRIIDSFTPDALDIFQREFRFFEKVTAISGVLYPLPKDARRAQIRR
jgi:phosphatidylinositol 4-kinase